MNKPKVGLIISVLEDCAGLCEGDLQNGARCVVGELLFEEGFTRAQLKQMSDSLSVPSAEIGTVRVPGYGSGRGYEKPDFEADITSLEWHALECLEEVYGLSRVNVTQLIHANDDIGDMAIEDAAGAYVRVTKKLAYRLRRDILVKRLREGEVFSE